MIIVKAILIGIVLLILPTLVIAADTEQRVHIAVASNFVYTLKQLSNEFEKQTGIDTVISTGSTGKLYAQIVHGAPYDVFMSADVLRAKMLEQQHTIVADSRFTYATGKLVVWHPQIERFSLMDIKKGKLNRIAVANPKLAPYGLAAMQVLQNADLWDSVQANLIRGENVSQALQFAQSGNVEAAFVSQAAMIAMNQHRYLSLAQNLYEPIYQQAVLLRDKPSAQSFVTYLKSEKAKEIIQKNGYSTH